MNNADDITVCRECRDTRDAVKAVLAKLTAKGTRFAGGVYVGPNYSKQDLIDDLQIIAGEA